MNRKPVSSSNVASVGYDAKSKTLEVEFNNGSVYQYLHVPKSVYQDLLDASSVGKFLAEEIKSNYRYVKIG